MEGLWLVAILAVFLAAVIVSRRQWLKKLQLWTPKQEQGYSLWLDERGVVRVVGFDRHVVNTELGRFITARLLPAHLFALGAVAGAALSFRVGQVLLVLEERHLAYWDLAWIAVVGLVWLVTGIVEQLWLLPRILREMVEEGLAPHADPLHVAVVFHYALMRHRLGFVMIAALGLPANWLATLVIILLVAAMWLIFRSEATSQEFWMAIPGDLEKPFLKLKDQLIEGLWITPFGLLLVLSAGALLYFNDVSSFMVAALSAIACGFVVASERMSRLYSQATTTDELRSRLNELFLSRVSHSTSALNARA